MCDILCAFEAPVVVRRRFASSKHLGSSVLEKQKTLVDALRVKAVCDVCVNCGVNQHPPERASHHLPHTTHGIIPGNVHVPLPVATSCRGEGEFITATLDSVAEGWLKSLREIRARCVRVLVGKEASICDRRVTG